MQFSDCQCFSCVAVHSDESASPAPSTRTASLWTDVGLSVSLSTEEQNLWTNNVLRCVILLLVVYLH